MAEQKTSRQIAIETLHQLQSSTLPLPVLLQHVSDEQHLGGSDRGLSMNLIYGVLRHRQYLDVLIAKLCRQPLRKLHPFVHQALAVGLYQLFFLNRIPESAAVNETVNAAKKTPIPKRLHGFINGVLRQSIRQRQELPQPGEADTTGGPILNHPQWLTDRWQRHFGREKMLAICKQNSQQQPLSLRVNTLKISSQDFLDLLTINKISAEPGRFATCAVLMHDYHGPVERIPGYAEGYFQVQDEAAQLAGFLLQPLQHKGRYLDGCSGLGGKTSHLYELLDGFEAWLTAVEPQPQRQDRLVTNMNRLFPETDYRLFRGDLQQFHAVKEQRFHGILIDAPCSGTGVTGRHPDIRWRRQEADIKRYSTIQSELINLAASMLLPNGILVYATCSLEPEENQKVITQFLQQNSNFSLSDCASFLPSAAAPLVRNHYFQPLPCDLLDGFFAARLVCNSRDD